MQQDCLNASWLCLGRAYPMGLVLMAAAYLRLATMGGVVT